jgi:osmotically-inducible protein OsmY
MALRSDADIRRDAETELKNDPALHATDIAMKVTNGELSLTGYVHEFSQKYAAEDAVKRVTGVTAIANDIELRSAGAPPSDPEIARAAVRTLKQALPVCWQQIRPVVHQGIVTLEGVVDFTNECELAARVVHGLKGVVGVVNKIALAASFKCVQLHEVRRLIEESLDQQTDEISVETRGAEVTLRGRVHSWAQRRQAEESALAAPGVQRVHNELVVRF